MEEDIIRYIDTKYEALDKRVDALDKKNFIIMMRFNKNEIKFIKALQNV